ncbi:hypothetical protein O1611_g1978 [Lasiodiplodia mahajangana]|uniref:Uncharacterized protein n=1 Tax=Lasiodiplodia mahajangana TaxID=1108764 RepID=A0ACC2JVV8_9PEZI|nr:hypothetical protein O1611_g1978 [Lasiodiplodia mahajangana]
MATRSNTGRAEHDAERGVEEGVRPRDTSHSTRVVRDITYKAIPFCAFSLVVFSAGAILVSTLAFDKPIPHKAAIVVSSILLSFFLLFCTGLVYLYFRKFHPHVSKGSGVSRQRSHSDSPTWDYVKSIIHRFKRFASRRTSYPGEVNGATPQGGEGGRTLTDTLRDPAPSPEAYRRATTQEGNIASEQNAIYELEESESQQNLQLPQQREPQDDRGDRPLQQGSPEANPIPRGRTRNRRIPTYTANAPRPIQAHSHPTPQSTQENAAGSPRRGDLTQSPSLVRNYYHVAGPREYVRKPTPQQRIAERSRDVHRQAFPSQIPTIRVAAPPEPPLPPPPGSVQARSRQLRDPAVGAYTENMVLPKLRTENSERWRRDNLVDDPSLAHAPIAGSRKSTLDKAEGQATVPTNAFIIYSSYLEGRSA